MKTLMLWLWPLMLAASLLQATENSPRNSFTYDGQNSENVILELIRKETRYRDRVIDTTCERQVQVGEREQCGNETRYRQECHTVPGRNHCYDVYDQDCRTVTRYRQDCSYEPGRQVCRQGPARQVCTTRRNGAQVCATQPGEQICHTEPGRQVCRQVPYSDRECRQVTRTQCDWIPAQQECRNVAYNEWVCRQVPVYETQTYACQQTVKEPYEVVAEKVNANIDYEFAGATNGARAKFNTEVVSGGRVILTAKDQSSQSKLIIAKRKLSKEVNGNEVTVNGTVEIRFQNEAALLAPVKTALSNFELGQNSMSFLMGKVQDASDLSLTVTIKREGETELSKKLARSQFSLSSSGNKSKVDFNFNKHFGLKLSRGVFKKHVYDVTITAELALPSELLNTPAPATKKTQTFSARPDKD